MEEASDCEATMYKECRGKSIPKVLTISSYLGKNKEEDQKQEHVEIPDDRAEEAEVCYDEQEQLNSSPY